MRYGGEHGLESAGVRPSAYCFSRLTNEWAAVSAPEATTAINFSERHLVIWL